MTSIVAQANTGNACQMLPDMQVPDKGSRNKRKYRADPTPDKTSSGSRNECSSYEFSAEKFDMSACHEHSDECDICFPNQNPSDVLKLDLGLSTTAGPLAVGTSRSRDATELPSEFHDADWSDLTETQLEGLVLSNLDTIFKGAIKKIVACGYSEEVASMAVLRSGLCYGCKDTVSNVVDNTLAFLTKGQEIDPSRENCFQDLEQMEKYVLAELVCVLREVRPYFSTGDAMWCLLICDMNVSLACAVEDPFSGLPPNGSDSQSIPTQPKSSEVSVSSSEPRSSVSCNNLNLCKCDGCPVAALPFADISQSKSPSVPAVTNLVKPKTMFGLASEKENSISSTNNVDKSSGARGMIQSQTHEDKSGGSRKVSGITKRGEYILRQKSLHLEKSYRTYGSKGSSRSGKVTGFSGLMLEKKRSSLSDSAVNVKSASLKINKAMSINVGPTNGSANSSTANQVAFKSETVNNTVSSSPKTNIPSRLLNKCDPPGLSAADTELSLSLPMESNIGPLEASSSASKPLGHWFPQDRKEELIMQLAPRVRNMQSQLQEWDEWANQKVMQATRRLTKEKAELQALRLEKEEAEREKKEQQTLEENTVKKLFELDSALGKTEGQVDRTNAAAERLKIENSNLRAAQTAAKLRATQSALSCAEATKSEKMTLMKFQSWEKEKSLIQEEVAAEKRKSGQLQREVGQAKDLQDQLEARWKQEEKAKEELLSQASSIRKEREQIEASAKLKEEMIKSKAESNMKKYKDDILRLEKEISQLRLKTDSSKIAALRGGTASLAAPPPPFTPGIVKRERECVMCLSEEMSVVFLPCAHQVVCTTCNELHQKQGMKDCPSCRSTIQSRISVRYAGS